MASTGSSPYGESLLLEQHRKSALLGESNDMVAAFGNTTTTATNSGDQQPGYEQDSLMRHHDDNDDDNDHHHHIDHAHHDFDGAELLSDYLLSQQQQQPNNHNNNLDLMDFGRTRRSRMSFVAPDDKLQLSTTETVEAGGAGVGSSLLTPVGASTAGAATATATAAADYGSTSFQSFTENENEHDDVYFQSQKTKPLVFVTPHPCPAHGPIQVLRKVSGEIFEQLPAILATTLLILMASIPFGVAYFPIQWSSSVLAAANGNEEEGGQDNDISTSFPLPGKESLGIRMALFATLVGQVVLTFTSNFANPVSFQLMENIPFYHALAHIVIEEQGYGVDALATLFFLFGLSSVMVGLVFYFLGRFKLGRLAYFFPAHVLVGCIGGIGVFIIISSIEVTNNEDFTFNMEGVESFVRNFHLYGLVMLFEGILRILTTVLVDDKGNQKYRFLPPIYFCSIVPVFYLGFFFVLGFTVEQAQEWGYLFPDQSFCSGPDMDCDSLTFNEKVFNGHILDMFKVIDFRLINWTAVSKSFGTLVALCSFSLIHVPINIPAFAVSTNVDVDMNNELMAHGYSNMLSGFFGGLQNVMTYSFSVLFMKSGGRGIPACLTLSAGIVFMFVYGSAIAVYFPRCMAGTLLLHIGLDLFLEGCYDSFGKFDALEYSGIWFITIVMQAFGMTAALLAGILSALSTYAVQSITHLDPVFRITHATTLRSSAWGRPSGAMEILEHVSQGRSRVLIIQLQGHLFFGNIADLTDTIKQTLLKKKGTDEQPLIVVLDFTLVVGMDSSASHAIAKLKGLMHQIYRIEVSIFVSGTHRDGFPCAYALSEALSETESLGNNACDYNDILASSPDPSKSQPGSVSISMRSKSMKAAQFVREFPRNRVCNSLDEALVFAEDILVARQDPSLLTKGPYSLIEDPLGEEKEMTEREERDLAESYLESVVPLPTTPDLMKSIKKFVAKCVREEYNEGDIIWKEGAKSDSVKILVRGIVCATLEGTRVCEIVARGNIFGELGLVDGTRRLSTVTCRTKVVIYSLNKDVFDNMVQWNHREARLLERIAIRYLAHRVQHVSNRIVDTHCLPI